MNEEAAALYEGAKVYANHVEGDGVTRDVDTLRGVIRSPRVSEGKIRGDLHVLSGDSGDRIIDLARDHPDTAFGLSHDVEGHGFMEDERLIVESLETVHSVDIVDRPATNRSLFESRIVGDGESASHSEDTAMSGDKKFTEAEVEARVAAAVKEAEKSSADGKKLAEAQESAKVERKRADDAEKKLKEAEAAKVVDDTIAKAKLTEAAEKEVRRRLEGEGELTQELVEGEIKAIESLLGDAAKSDDESDGSEPGEPNPRRLDEEGRGNKKPGESGKAVLNLAESALGGGDFEDLHPEKK